MFLNDSGPSSRTQSILQENNDLVPDNSCVCPNKDSTVNIYLIRTSELSGNRNNKDLEGHVVRIKWALPNKFNETCGAKVQI